MAFTLVYALLAMLQVAASQSTVPYCIQNCLTAVKTELCSTHVLPQLISCISNECLNAQATQNLIANLGVSFSPKLEYSCQQSVVPGTPDSSISLPLNQSCTTSPYDFKSFVPSASSAINAANGCQVLIYSDEECLGEAGSVDIGTVEGGRCIFHGGRSARLTCNNELDAARAFIESTCNSDEPLASLSSSLPSYGSPTSYSGSSPSSATDASPATNSVYTSFASRSTHYLPLPTSSAIANATVPTYGNTTSTSETSPWGTGIPVGTTTEPSGATWMTYSTPSTTASSVPLPTYTGAAVHLGTGGTLVIGAVLALF